jgi:hypothetical protein
MHVEQAAVEIGYVTKKFFEVRGTVFAALTKSFVE